ncbi:MAG: hypothetical protein KF841_09485 [Phycisphaerae bacterium]|nr:hypothetical protein [Phycisphaerae bacterium]
MRGLDSVGSTSWHNRHLGAFQRLRSLLAADGAVNPTILIVGPGGVTRLFAPLLNDSSRALSRSRKIIGDLARYADQLFRRFPFAPLESLEPVELSRTIAMPHRLVVIDRSRRVLAAVARDLPESVTHCVDISTTPIPGMADVVVAFNVVCRLDPACQADGMRRVAEAVRPGGLLMVDDRTAEALLSVHADFHALGDKLHRRLSSSSCTSAND